MKRYSSIALCLALLPPLLWALPRMVTAQVNIQGGSQVKDSIIGGRDVNITNAPKQPSLIEQAVGAWQLSSFSEKVRSGVTYGIDIQEGTLSVEPNGRLVWSVIVLDRFSPRYRIRVKSTGQIQPTGQIEPVKGGQYNETAFLSDSWQISRRETDLTVRGWSTEAKKPEPFRLTVEGNLLSMENSRGTITWLKSR